MDMAIDLESADRGHRGPLAAPIQEGVATRPSTVASSVRLARPAASCSNWSLILGSLRRRCCSTSGPDGPHHHLTRENSNTFVTGPTWSKASTGETISMADLGGGEVHNRVVRRVHYHGGGRIRRHRLCAHRARLPPSNSESKPPVYATMSPRAERETAKRRLPPSCLPTNVSPTTCSK